MSYISAKRTFFSAIFLAIVLALSACSILPKAEPQLRYNLPSSPLLNTSANQSPHALFVATPMANRLISSNKILVQPMGTEMQAYKGALWADNATVLLRERLVEAISEATLFQAVTQDSSLNTHYALESYLRTFQVQYQADQPVIIVQLDAQLVDRNTNDILYTHRFAVQQPSAGTGVDHIVTAFGVATDQLSQQVLKWLVTSVPATP